MTTFVFVHGGWDGGWAWTPVVQRLQALGHEAFAPTLTGSGERVHLASPEVDLNTHIMDVANLLTYEDLHDVVLVGSSSGGMMITGVADQMPERIRRLIYLDAFAPNNGQSIFDIVGPDLQPAFEQAAVAFGEGWRIPFQDPTADRRTDTLLAVATQPILLQNPDAVGLARTYVLFTNKGEDNILAPVFERIASDVRETEGWDYLERPWVHYPVLDQEDGVDAVTDLMIELTESS